MKTIFIFACVIFSVMASNFSDNGAIDENAVTNEPDKNIKNHEPAKPVTLTTESNGLVNNPKNVTGQNNGGKVPTRNRTHRYRNHRRNHARKPRRKHHGGRKDNQHRRTHRNKRLH